MMVYYSDTLSAGPREKGPPEIFFEYQAEKQRKENISLRIYQRIYSGFTVCLTVLASIQGFRQDFSQNNFNLCGPDFPKIALRSAKADPADLWRKPCSVYVTPGDR